MSLTFDQIEKNVRELAAYDPNFVYEAEGGNCLYNPTADQPGCIFGQALLAEDVEIYDAWEGDSIEALLPRLDVKATYLEAAWAGEVQGQQDNGTPWSDAVQKADRKRAELEHAIKNDDAVRRGFELAANRYEKSLDGELKNSEEVRKANYVTLRVSYFSTVDEHAREGRAW